MKVPKMCWALLIIAMGCMVASWGVGIFDPAGVKAPGYKLLQSLWFSFTMASALAATAALLAYGLRLWYLRRMRMRIAKMLGGDQDGLEAVKAMLAKDGWAYSETGGEEGEKTWSWSKGPLQIMLKGSSHKMQPGDRVTAFVCTNGKKRTLDLLGHGVFAGRFPPPPEWHIDEPMQLVRIDLDSGQSVWGPQCWWGTESHVANEHPKPEWTWLQVDVDAFLAEWNAARLKDWQEEQANAEPQAQTGAAPQA